MGRRKACPYGKYNDKSYLIKTDRFLNADFFDSIILGLIQGFTEFLPVSSSGHLVLAKAALNIRDTPLIYDIFFHFATVLAICTLFRNELARIISAFAGYIFRTIRRKGRRDLNTPDKDAGLALFIIVGSIPAALVGFILDDSLRDFFTSPKSAAMFLWLTGAILVSTYWSHQKHKHITAGSALLIGFGQAMALLPGVSRSGTTIAAGLWLGIKPEDAVKFSFFLAIPAILGTNILEFSTIPLNLLKNEVWNLLAGGFTAYISGLIAIILLMKTIRRGRFFWFGIYCSVIGTIAYFIV